MNLEIFYISKNHVFNFFKKKSIQRFISSFLLKRLTNYLRNIKIVFFIQNLTKY